MTFYISRCILLHTSFRFFIILHYKKRLSSLHIFVHHCAVCTSLHVKTSPVKTPKHHHITPILKKLHWLKIPERIEYKAISLTYNTLQSSQPSYLRQLFTIQPPRLTRSSSALALFRPSVTTRHSNLLIAL